MKSVKEIERSIITTYRKDIWRKFIASVETYQLISEGDKIAVCISGGKDSFLMAKCLQELKRHGKITFQIKFILMNPGYKKQELINIKQLANSLDIALDIFNTNIFAIVKKLKVKSPCFLCSKMRRGYLYSYALKLGCNKIALGHHFNDVIETTILDMFYNGRFEGMLPKLKSANFKNMTLIRPLYLVREASIINWANYNEIKFPEYNCGLNKKDSKREEIKKLIKEMRLNNKFIEDNIFKSLENINLNEVLGYYKNGTKYNYLDDY